MAAKLSVLRATRRALRPGGRTVFTSILAAPGLTAAARRRAHEAMPLHARLRVPYVRLLESAGFIDIEARDVTERYRVTQHAWLDESTRQRQPLVEVMGAEMFDQRQSERRAAADALDEGLVRRSMFVAARPRRRV